MTDLPSPLTPADCDLRDFSFMPLDVVRLRDCDLSVHATGDEFRCAVLLWCASWHQVPAASIPNDDVVLAQLAGFGRVVKEWLKVRAGALRGWVECSDGRIYHPVVAEKANEAWAGRLAYRAKKEAERLRKAAEREAKKAADDATKSIGRSKGQIDLSGGQGSGVLRTDGVNPPEIALKETVDSGQREGQLNPVDAPEVGIRPTRAGELSAAMRTLGIQANPADPRLIALAEQGVSPETVRAACEDAKRAKPDERIAPGYVFSIIERWAADASKLKATGAQAPARGAAQKFDPVAYVNRNRVSENHERTDDVIDV
jgi:hypothetical protein